MSDFGQTRSFNFGLAQETSVEAALIYDDLAYAQHMVGKKKWFYRSYEQLMNRLPYSEKTLRRHIDKLVEQGWVSKKVMKINGTPICHYQISRFLSAKMTDSMETDKMTDSIYNNSKTTKKAILDSSNSFGASNNSNSAAPAADAAARGQNPVVALLEELIQIVNPREKVTDDRRRKLHARLKEYTIDEIIGAAKAFSKSTWHRNNKQMSIDNLLAPSKFGRWYAQRDMSGARQKPDGMFVTDPIVAKGDVFPADWPEGREEWTFEYDEEDEKISYFRGVRINGDTQSEIIRIQTERGEM